LSHPAQQSSEQRVISGELKTTSTERLNTLIDETEDRLHELKAELRRREEARQHQAIDNLEDYLEAASLRLSPLKDLISVIIDELRGKKA
jgi:small-conductance mechanosensitive channel